MTLSRLITDPAVVHADWLAELPDGLRSLAPPTGTWWRLHEDALALAFGVPVLDGDARRTPWGRMCGLNADALRELEGALARCTWPDAASHGSASLRFARELPRAAINALHALSADNAPGAWLLACARSAASPIARALKLRYPPSLWRALERQSCETFSAADLRFGARVATILVGADGSTVAESPTPVGVTA